MNKFFSAAACVAASVLATTAASAALTISATPYALSATGNGVLIDFDSALLGGFTLTGSGYTIQSGDNGYGAAPAGGSTNAFDDVSKYLSVYGGAATLASATGYKRVSLFWGSVDGYNALDLLDANGNVLSTVANTDVPSVGNGDQLGAATNQRVNIASTDAFFGLRFRSPSPAFEADNVQLSGAVPEPSSWAMMLGGFGMLGGVLRNRRKPAVSFG